MTPVVRVIQDTKANAVWDGSDPTQPTILYDEWAEVIECGCKVVVGTRMDKREAATVACPCGDEHLPILVHFQAVLVASLDHPQDRPAVEVVRDLLEAAFTDA